MFTTGETYRDLGGDYFAQRNPELAQRNPERQTKRLLIPLERLGHTVTRHEAA